MANLRNFLTQFTSYTEEKNCIYQKQERHLDSANSIIIASVSLCELVWLPFTV